VRLLVGLGNPGTKYERTRHNVGFRIARHAADELGMALDQTRWHAVLGTGRVRGEQIAVMLPQTYMNASGESVGHAVRFWKVEPGGLVVVHDELDLELGRIQVKMGGGDGGHNGLKSLRQHLGPDFLRVRFGIGRPPQEWDSADFVLANFLPEEEAKVDALVPSAAEAAVTALLEGAAVAMNRFNRWPKETAAERTEEQDEVTLAGGTSPGKPKR
jgi:peptidyl-tRNA hydrolase, PTH1 family